MLRRSFLLGLAGGLLVACSATEPQVDATYYLVRHAEKTAVKPDPALTEPGMMRALALGERLKDVSLSAVYSTDTLRTRETARPVTEMQDLSLQIYDARNLPAFAESLKAQSGHILVVGHSNTTPQLAGLLGGNPGAPIVEATEYNRLYVITKSGDVVVSDIQTYGR